MTLVSNTQSIDLILKIKNAALCQRELIIASGMESKSGQNYFSLNLVKKAGNIDSQLPIEEKKLTSWRVIS